MMNARELKQEIQAACDAFVGQQLTSTTYKEVALAVKNRLLALLSGKNFRFSGSLSEIRIEEDPSAPGKVQLRLPQWLIDDLNLQLDGGERFAGPDDEELEPVSAERLARIRWSSGVSMTNEQALALARMSRKDREAAIERMRKAR